MSKTPALAWIQGGEPLFDPFRQESGGLARACEGTGLGLTVTKKAVDRMGGSIDVETEQGEGSHFTVRLPGPTQRIAAGPRHRAAFFARTTLYRGRLQLPLVF